MDVYESRRVVEYEGHEIRVMVLPPVAPRGSFRATYEIQRVAAIDAKQRIGYIAGVFYSADDAAESALSAAKQSILVEPIHDERPVDKPLIFIEVQNRMFFSAFLPIMAAALLVPDEMLSSSAFLSSYVSALGQLFSSIDALADVSHHPDATRIVLSIAYSLVPVYAIVFFPSVRPNVPALRVKRARALGMLAGAFVIAWAYCFMLTPLLDGDRVMDRMSMSRIWLGFYAAAAVPVVALMMVICIQILRRVRQIFS